MAKAHPLSFLYDVILITRRRHISNISDLIFIVVFICFTHLPDLPHKYLKTLNQIESDKDKAKRREETRKKITTNQRNVLLWMLNDFVFVFIYSFFVCLLDARSSSFCKCVRFVAICYYSHQERQPKSFNKSVECSGGAVANNSHPPNNDRSTAQHMKCPQYRETNNCNDFSDAGPR